MNGGVNGKLSVCRLLGRLMEEERAVLAQRENLSRREARRGPEFAHYLGMTAENQRRDLAVLDRLARQAGCRLPEPEEGPAPGEDPVTARQRATRLAEDLRVARRVAAAVQQALLGGLEGSLPPERPLVPWCGPLRHLIAQARQNLAAWQGLAEAPDPLGPEARDFARAAAAWREQDLGVLEDGARLTCGGEEPQEEPSRNGKLGRPPAL